ncbi:MAG: ribonuclease III [Bdellovibrionales bacterium]|nr:ribonuclease III [Bdellovibrionales bacterium]
MKELEALQAALKYTFSDRGILLQALTHTSYGHEHFPKRPLALRDNERLEFLGDAILDAIVSDILLECYPDYHEGRLSKIRAAVVNEKTLTEVALRLGLDQAVRLGKGEASSGGTSKPSILSSTFEAIVAGIYLDGGFNAVFPVVRSLFQPFFKADAEILHTADPKTRLQETIQAAKKVTPSYHLLGAEGPDHAKTFTVEVRIAGEPIAAASGSSKKDAEQNAARRALDDLEAIPPVRLNLNAPEAEHV